MINDFVINTYKTEKGDNFRMEYVTGYVIPMLNKFIYKEVGCLDELKINGYAPIWDTRNNPIVKIILEKLLNVKLTGIVKRDKETLQSYLSK